MRPLSQDLLGCPWSFNRLGRAEKWTGCPCEICWKICHLLPVFLTSFIPLHFYALAFSRLSHPPPQLEQKSLNHPHPRDEKLGILVESCRNNKKSTILAAYSPAAGVLWHCRGLLTPSADEFTKLLILQHEILCPAPLGTTLWFCFSFYRFLLLPRMS